MSESKKAGRSTTDELTASRYYGGLCKKHPELNGLRSLGNRWCVGCRRDAMRRVASGQPSTWLRVSRAEYNELLERIGELEKRLYGAAQRQEP